MQVILTPTESETHFHNALCNGLGYIGGYGLELTFKDTDYEAAKSKLDNPCYEDVLLQILKDGGTLTLEDTEGSEEPASITLKEVHERVQNMPFSHLADIINENDDACTADVLLQTVFLNELIYG